MKNIIFFFTLFISLVVVKPGYAQSFFEEISIPDTAYIQSIAINNQGDIFLTSGSGNRKGGILRLLEGDTMWQSVYSFSGINGPLSIEITNSGTIYVGTNVYQNYLLRSFDNGYTWEDSINIPGSRNVVSILTCGEDSIMVARNPTKPIVIHSIDGGNTWECDTVSTVNNNFICDLEITKEKVVYLGMSGFSSNHGGIYKSTDFGETWEFDGLLDHQVISVAISSMGDIFTGDWGVTGTDVEGVYCKRHDSQEYELVMDAFEVGDIILTKQDYLYVNSLFWIYGTPDYGQTIDTIYDTLGLTMRHFMLDNEGYLYGSNALRLIKSLQPVSFGVGQRDIEEESIISLFPNPVSDRLSISISSNEHYDISHIKIYNLSGNLVSNIESPPKSDIYITRRKL
ncbi:MAG: hypothetical protein PHT77_12995 [Bacteroidales bacterium]|nr:hypothetical protein [Bacteroidales bacterium]